jgi:hypothetical protein
MGFAWNSFAIGRCWDAMTEGCKALLMDAQDKPMMIATRT